MAIYEVIYGGSSNRVNGGGGSYTYIHAGGGGPRFPMYRNPTSQEANVVFYPGSGTIVKAGSGGYIPPYINVNGNDYPVKNIAKGAYQGLGLITVVLPETLEVIEDYAFAGNQLIGITIPNSVYHIGHYAFAFNEVWKVGNINGPERKATLKTIIIKEEEQFDKVNKYGNIINDEGNKVELYQAPIIAGQSLGPEIRLLDHIWVTSIGNVVIDVEYTPDKCWPGQKGPVIFCGASPAAFDDNEDTYHSGNGLITWKGELKGKAVEVKLDYTEASGHPSVNLYIQDDDDNNNLKFIDLLENKELKKLSGKSIKTVILIPENASKIAINATSSTAQIFDIKVLHYENNLKPVSNVKSTANSSSINLVWEQNDSEYEKALIYRNGEFVNIITGHNYTDTPLQANAKYEYSIYPISKSGNVNWSYNNHIEFTDNLPILLKGISPAAFDKNENTIHSGDGTMTWEGDLEGKALYVSLSYTSGSGHPAVRLYVKDSENKDMKFIDLNAKKEVSLLSGNIIKTNILIPEGAKKIIVNATSSTARIHEIQVINDKDIPSPITNIQSVSSESSILLNWEQPEKDYSSIIIYKNDKFYKIVDGHSHEDKPLYSGTQYNYKIYALNKYGNRSTNSTMYQTTTIKPNILLRGLDPAAFDGNENTFHSGNGTMTWEGDLEGKALYVSLSYTSGSGHPAVRLYVKDSENKDLPFINLNTNKETMMLSGNTIKTNILVPKGASKIVVNAVSSTARVHEIRVIE